MFWALSSLSFGLVDIGFGLHCFGCVKPRGLAWHSCLSQCTLSLTEKVVDMILYSLDLAWLAF